MQVVERLGTETDVVVGIDAPRLRAAALSDAIDASAADDDVLLAEDDRASLTVVLDARAPVAVGDRIELTIDPDRLHHFDIETGEALSRRAAIPPCQRPLDQQVDAHQGKDGEQQDRRQHVDLGRHAWRVAPKMNSGNVCVWPALNDVIT